MPKKCQRNAKEIIKNNKSIVTKTFSITIIIMAILYVIINPTIRSIIDTLMTSINLGDEVYGAYRQTLDIMSVGMSLLFVSIFSDFILCSLALDLIRNKPFSKESILSRLSSIDKYLISKVISFLIQFIWYIVLNIVRVVTISIGAVIILRVFGVVTGIISGNVSSGHIYFVMLVAVLLALFIFTINVMIFSETFVLPFIALDTQNDFDKKDIYKVYKSVMKKIGLNHLSYYLVLYHKEYLFCWVLFLVIMHLLL